MTVIRLLNGTRVNLQTVIDNVSRRILAWKVAAREPRLTRELLLEAAKSLPADAPAPNVVVDAGTENLNEQMDALESSGIIKRVLAQVEVVHSNSMIEAWWRSLKHQWLFLDKLDKMAAVERLVAFYMEQHNAVMPHSGLGGLTPDDVYVGTGAGVRVLWRRAREVLPSLGCLELTGSASTRAQSAQIFQLSIAAYGDADSRGQTAPTNQAEAATRR